MSSKSFKPTPLPLSVPSSSPSPSSSAPLTPSSPISPSSSKPSTPTPKRPSHPTPPSPSVESEKPRRGSFSFLIRKSSKSEISPRRSFKKEKGHDLEEANGAYRPQLKNVQEYETMRKKENQKEKEKVKEGLFRFVIVVRLEPYKDGGYVPSITYRYPPMSEDGKEGEKDNALLASIPQFCFPDLEKWKPLTTYPSETFSFILTELDGSKNFGYCRRLLPAGDGPRLPEVYCLVSEGGCFSLFAQILNIVEERRKISSSAVFSFLKSVSTNTFPGPGEAINVKTFAVDGARDQESYRLVRPDDLISYEHVTFAPLFQSLTSRKGLMLFSSLLLERRIIFCSSSLRTLSECCHAALALLYPFEWQHVLIPILPRKLIDFCCSPTPFVIGILLEDLPLLKTLPLEEVIIINIDERKFIRKDFDDAELFGWGIYSALKPAIKKVFGKEAESRVADRDAVIIRSFLNFMVEMTGRYRQFMKNDNGKVSFQQQEFIEAQRSKEARKFLELFTQSQMFSMFIQEREDLENAKNEKEAGLLHHRISMVERFESAVDEVYISSGEKVTSNMTARRIKKKNAEASKY